MADLVVGKVDFLGETRIPRRAALKGLGFGALELLGLKILGAGRSNVGLTGGFDDAPFRSIGGFLDEKNTLTLPCGQSVIVGRYGNPILAPAAFHAAPLST
jgi:hypothetical protein